MLSVVLFSSLALAVDAGAGYGTRRVLQTSVDAAALAGAQDIAESRGATVARTTVDNYIGGNNSGRGGRTSVTFPDSSSVRVETVSEQTTFFARLFGRRTFPVKAVATARFGPAGSVENLVPIIVPYQSVAGHVGQGNQAVFVLGEDRPLDPLAITYTESGNQVTYTVTYVNTGNKSINLDMWSVVPAGATYVCGSVTGGGTHSGNTVRWLFNGVAAGDKRSATFLVRFSGNVNPRNDVWAKINGKVQTASTNTSQRGFFWLVDFDGGSRGTPDFADWIVNGYPNPVGIGNQGNGTGVKAALKAAMAERLAKDPKVILPLYDYTQGGGSQGIYHVVGFAEFVVTGFELTGNPKSVTGYFTDGTVTTGSGGDQNALDYGVRVVRLTE